MKLGTETGGQTGVSPKLDDVTGAIIDASLKIHKDLGPGLLESVYEALLAKELERRGSPDPLFTRWIGTYASGEFGALVEAVLAATNAMAARVGEPERAAMRRHFLATSRYEWMFWDMGWRREAWPV